MDNSKHGPLQTIYRTHNYLVVIMVAICISIELHLKRPLCVVRSRDFQLVEQLASWRSPSLLLVQLICEVLVVTENKVVLPMLIVLLSSPFAPVI